MHVKTFGLNLAKNVFQVHGTTESGEVAFNRALRRAQVLAFSEHWNCYGAAMKVIGNASRQETGRWLNNRA